MDLECVKKTQQGKKRHTVNYGSLEGTHLVDKVGNRANCGLLPHEDCMLLSIEVDCKAMQFLV